MLLTLLFVSLFVMLIMGVPVAVALAGSSLLYVLAGGTIPDVVVVHRMVNGIDSFPLLAIPFFILAGNLMNSALITNHSVGGAYTLSPGSPDCGATRGGRAGSGFSTRSSSSTSTCFGVRPARTTLSELAMISTTLPRR